MLQESGIKNQESVVKSKKFKGFSLVELMVVIAIIGVVSAVAASSISVIQKNSRDAQRVSDLNTLKVALQQFYADKHYYPNTMTLTAGAQLDSCTGDSGCTNPTKVYLRNTPVDPVSGTTTPYRYCSMRTATNTASCDVANFGQCHYFSLCATRENPSGTTTCSCASPATGNTQVNPL